jgi:hypothetical protein
LSIRESPSAAGVVSIRARRYSSEFRSIDRYDINTPLIMIVRYVALSQTLPTLVEFQSRTQANALIVYDAPYNITLQAIFSVLARQLASAVTVLASRASETVSVNSFATRENWAMKWLI